ncbi:MAG: FAD-dependent thymidylate synthase [Candidatus Dojkabacteria bacterium]|nr:FAD-dependent thymidylate synthase [Candidatus Dojkabacteria bacterium]
MTNLEEKYLDKGFVRLIDTMPQATEDNPGDWAVVQAARVSYGKGTKTKRDDEKLIRYLMKHRHTSPFEMIVLKFHIKCPIFTARQMFRHRTHSANEYSLRYSEIEDSFYVPEQRRIRTQSKENKQNSSDRVLKESEEIIKKIEEVNNFCYDTYKKLLNYDNSLEEPVSREVARIVLPLSSYTQFYWVQNMHNFLHFIHLRMSENSQEEIRLLAEKMFGMVKKLFPVTCQAWYDYVYNSVTLSKNELLYLKNLWHLTPQHGLISEKEEKELIRKIERIIHS